MKKLFCSLLFIPFCYAIARAQDVVVEQTAESITLRNGIVSFSFNTSNANLTAVVNRNGISLPGKKGRGYLLGPGFSMYPAQCRITRQEPGLVELSFLHEASNHFRYDLRYVLRKGVSGIYCYLVQSHKAGDSTGYYGQTRWGISADEGLFDYHLVRDSIQGPMPKMAELKDAVQDWTFRMSDSSYYTKYDYADYIEGRHVHGMAGAKSGLGLFVIQASHEYLNGGPTKQYQNVHSTPYLICMFNCGHFLSDIRQGDDNISGDWAKLDGPFLLYVNQGKNTGTVWDDAKAQARKEIAQWPYNWMQHAEYPLKRGTVTGKLFIENKPATEGTPIILAAPGYDWQAQTSGYIYDTRTGRDGKFTHPEVRPGRYTLYAYGSNETKEFIKNDISIQASATADLGKLEWTPPRNGNLLWQVGIADRTTKGFKLRDHKRYYGLFNLVPANLSFTVGKSSEQDDWYYAQTKPGNWNIDFSLDKDYSGKALLTIALAGAAKNPLLEVYVNGEKQGSFSKLGNDASVYRSAVAGGYYQELELSFPAALLKKGKNTISLRLPNVKAGGGLMYDALKLEATEHRSPNDLKKTAVLFSDNFEKGPDSNAWKVEVTPLPHSGVYVQNGKLILDTKGGATVWLNQLLKGNILIEYRRKVLQEGGPNDRVSDMNQFWMATDPRNKNLFARSGAFSEYDSLCLYYTGMGGNSNTTTRFRKYTGDGERRLLQEYTDSTHLLQPNREYRIAIAVKDGSTMYFVNDELFFSYQDPEPLRQGYFGFRSTKSRQEIDDFRVYRIQ
jgi:rhamnogalacturonan endolyase